MWISKKEREKMVKDRDSAIQECREWEAKYKTIIENVAVYHSNEEIVVSLQEQVELANVVLNALRLELESWKQKYAEIEQMKG